LGVQKGKDELETARRGVERLRDLAEECGITLGLRTYRVPEAAIPHLSAAAMAVTRLLRNNPREVTLEDAAKLYRAAM
jgi:alcohol dehydrogenase class IV